MSCTVQPPCQTHKGARAFKAKGVSGLGAFIRCVSFCLQDHRNAEARLCLLYVQRHLGVFLWSADGERQVSAGS